MKRAIALLFLSLFVAHQARANGLSDSVAAFTGARTVLVWLQDNWCNADYTVKAGCGSNDPALMILDTKEGVQRTLIPSVHISYLRISRSGQWLSYNDVANKKSYIINLATPNATPKLFLDNATSSYWCARAMWVDQNTGTEYAYCLDNYDATVFNGSAIYRVPFNTSTGVANLSGAAKIKCNSTERVDDAIAVSADGKKLGGAFPWPNTKILDTETGALADRHNGMFGCQANLSPDNQYILHHCEDDHLGVIMFGAYPSTNNWFVNMAVNLVGLPSNSYTMDFAAPRWSNHVQFFTTGAPMCDNADCYEGAECSFSAAQVKTLNRYKIGQWYLCKWAPDFKQIEKSMYITPDNRIKSWGGDAWIASGTVAPGYGTSAAIPQSRGDRAQDTRMTQGKTAVTIHLNTSSPSLVSIMDARGRLVQRTVATGELAIDTKGLVGAYIVSVQNETSHAVTRMIVGK